MPKDTVPEGAPERTRIAACRSILMWVIENAAIWTGGQRLDGGDLVVLTIFARSTRTYEAVVWRLAERGFGEQGMMLCRSLFEDMVDAHWASQNPELVTERLVLHDRFSRFLRAEAQRKFPDWFHGHEPPEIEVTHEELKEMRALFGRYGSKSWTGVPSIHSRLNSVLHCWKSEEDKRTVRFWLAWVNKLMNETVHPTAFSIGRLGAPAVNERDNFEWRFGSTSGWLTQALHAALWTYCQTVGLILEQYHPETSGELADRFAQALWSFHQAAHWEKTGRLEPPPDGPATN